MLMGKKNTPEGKVKTEVSRILEQYEPIYIYMSVPFGYGKSTLDYLCCYRGVFFSIETKAPGEVPTARQNAIAREIVGAGGYNFVIDNVDGTGPLVKFLEHLTHDASSGQRTAPARRRAVVGED
jgi:hypothetical protein